MADLQLAPGGIELAGRRIEGGSDLGACFHLGA
jgi:hypothetical protein